MDDNTSTDNSSPTCSTMDTITSPSNEKQRHQQQQQQQHHHHHQHHLHHHHQQQQQHNKLNDGNKRTGNCYCGKERNLNKLELLCAICKRWFHEACTVRQLIKLMPFVTNYIFVCTYCSPYHVESFTRTIAFIPDMCVTAIANLQQNAAKMKDNRILFDQDDDIIPFLEQYWDRLTTLPRRITQTWHTMVHQALLSDSKHIHKEKTENGDYLFRLNIDLTQIQPHYNSYTKEEILRYAEYQRASSSKNNRQTKRKILNSDSTTSTGGGSTGSSAGGSVGGVGGSGGIGGSGNSNCSISGNSVSGNRKGRPSSEARVYFPVHGYPSEHPFNKGGYRYVLAEPDPHAPFRQEFDDSDDWAGKPIPGWLYRVVVPHKVLLSLHDRAPQLKISEDRLAVTGEKGYSLVRATHYVNRGTWYYEVYIQEMPEGTATRLGWSQEYGSLQAPVGYDRFSYSWRSRFGTRFSESHGKHYSDGGYGEGDTLGFLIHLPEDEIKSNYLPKTYKDRPLVKFKSHLYYEEKDKIQETLKHLRVLPQSRIEFFKNGQSQGVAYTDINAGSYYPAISLYKNATVSVNFGPNFKYPDILTKYKAKGLCDRVEELFSEQALADLMYLTEHESQLRLDNTNS